MTSWPSIASFFLAVALPLSAIGGDNLSPDDWPQFRGRRAAGVADGQDLPVDWDGEAGSNIRWKTAIPGLGHASPVICGGRVFIVTVASSDPAWGVQFV